MRTIASVASVAVLVAACARETPQPADTSGPRTPLSATSAPLASVKKALPADAEIAALK